MWSGTIVTIPKGWGLCNGDNGTPDLRNQFIIGAYADSGGQAKTTVEGGYTKSGGLVSHNHDVYGGAFDYGTDEANLVYIDPANHLPPYYALAFIMKL